MRLCTKYVGISGAIGIIWGLECAGFGRFLVARPFPLCKAGCCSDTMGPTRLWEELLVLVDCAFADSNAARMDYSLFKWDWDLGPMWLKT